VLKKRNFILLTMLNLTPYIYANGVKEERIKIDTAGELRLGAVQIEDTTGDKTSTLSLGGNVQLKTEPIYGFSAGATFYTTNALFGKNSEPMFLDSNSKSYSIVGEAYMQVNFGKTEIKAGRQSFESPFINGDDIGMIPNQVEGYSMIDRSTNGTTIVLGSFYKWSGIDTERPEKFTKMQESNKPVIVVGLIYEAIEDTRIEMWNYKVDGNDWNYIETKYENNEGSIAVQYSDQGDGNSIYGVDVLFNMSNLSLHTAYNKVSGTISNGFGGGPFFTSSEDHTVHETLNDEAKLIGAEYALDNLTIAINHVIFKENQNETDYSASYAFNDNLSVDLIHSDMNHDGEMSRFFVNYQF